MSNAITLVSAALNYDVAESMLAGGFRLADCYALAVVAGDLVTSDEVEPASCKTVLAPSSDTLLSF
jgi:thiamine monophosphate kinase